MRLAEITALLHDIGRFEQYARYKTFVDIKSENHALLGIKILKKFKVLEPFDPDIQEIYQIPNHNKIQVIPFKFKFFIVSPDNQR